MNRTQLKQKIVYVSLAVALAGCAGMGGGEGVIEVQAKLGIQFLSISEDLVEHQIVLGLGSGGAVVVRGVGHEAQATARR